MQDPHLHRLPRLRDMHTVKTRSTHRATPQASLPSHHTLILKLLSVTENKNKMLQGSLTLGPPGYGKTDSRKANISGLSWQ